MSEFPREGLASSAENAAASPASAGALLRQARLARGLHIAALAAAIKVTPRKLELLESDQFDELSGPTFTRALAQTVCRTLKIDPAPVLALLPGVAGHGLEQVSRGLNAPFSDRPWRHGPGDGSRSSWAWLIGAVLLVAVLWGIYNMPAGWLKDHWPTWAQLGVLHQQPVARASAVVVSPEPSASSVSSADEPVLTPFASASSMVSEVLAPADPVNTSAASALGEGPAIPPMVPAAEPAVAPGGTVAALPVSTLTPNATVLAHAQAASVPTAWAGSPLVVHARSTSWLEVVDGRGRPVLARMVLRGETVMLDGPSPLRVKIGKASALEVTYKGVAVDLAPVTTRDVAKLELR